jgi:hypothetical protein
MEDKNEKLVDGVVVYDWALVHVKPTADGWGNGFSTRMMNVWQ